MVSLCEYTDNKKIVRILLCLDRNRTICSPIVTQYYFRFKLTVLENKIFCDFQQPIMGFLTFLDPPVLSASGELMKVWVLKPPPLSDEKLDPPEPYPGLTLVSARPGAGLIQIFQPIHPVEFNASKPLAQPVFIIQVQSTGSSLFVNKASL